VPVSTLDVSVNVRVVFFDLGGVVIDSPIFLISNFEKQWQLPPNTLNSYLSSSTLFHELEMGTISLSTFLIGIDKQVQDENEADGANHPLYHQRKLINFTRIFDAMTESIRIRPSMTKTIKRLRAAGLIVVAITNNWKTTDQSTEADGMDYMRQLFDDVVQSCVEGIRKPDARLFHIALERTQKKQNNNNRHQLLTFQECVFLDDIPSNLVTAKKLGIKSIRVGRDEVLALKQLQQLIPHIDLNLDDPNLRNKEGKPPLALKNRNSKL